MYTNEGEKEIEGAGWNLERWIHAHLLLCWRFVNIGFIRNKTQVNIDGSCQGMIPRLQPVKTDRFPLIEASPVCLSMMFNAALYVVRRVRNRASFDEILVSR